MPWVDTNCLPWFKPMSIDELYVFMHSGAVNAPNLWRFDMCRFLTTPVAYLSSMPRDPFAEQDSWWRGTFYYWNLQDRWKYSLIADPPWTVAPPDQDNGLNSASPPLWSLGSMGPDFKVNQSGYYDGTKMWTQYDPTNGTVSKGDIFTVGPE